MRLSRERLYLVLFAACSAGYFWIYLNLQTGFTQSSFSEVCLIHKLCGIPCPSCGSTRSVIALLAGDPAKAFTYNPLGFLLFCILVLIPIWLLADCLLNSDSLHRFYIRAETVLKKRLIAIPLVFLLMLNWLWNISKCM
jgi:hypothetical protein